MSQYDFGNLESPLSGTEFINDNLEPWRDALHSSHSGASRPSYVVAGMIWVDTTTTPLLLLKLFDGTQDISIGTLNITSHTFTPSANAALVSNSVDTANIIAQAVANTKLAAMAANTIKANNTGSSASPADVSMGTSTILARLSGNIVAASITQILDLVVGTVGQGDILFRGASTYERLSAGTSGNILQTNGGSANPSWATPSNLISDSLTGQTITNAGTLTWTHGKGVKPKQLMCTATCTTNDSGYTVGQELVLSSHGEQLGTSGNGYGVSLVISSTTVIARFGSAGFSHINATTGGVVALTSASWTFNIYGIF